MLPQLEQALERIKDDSFGWCDDSGDAIGLKRLLISPTANTASKLKSVTSKSTSISVRPDPDVAGPHKARPR